MSDLSVLVIDLEATCSDDGSIVSEEMETIEIGACWATVNGDILDSFQSFVRPLKNPLLTSFCKTLTGISQTNVDTAPSFPIVAESLAKFASLYQAKNPIWMSWGKYDHIQIVRDSALHEIAEPIQIQHLNAKRLFAKNQRIGKEVGMARACLLTSLVPQGMHHRALDDAQNIARLLPWVFGERKLGKQI